jgi:hypothetical protein
MKDRTMNYDNFRITDEETDFQQFAADEDAVVIDFSGLKPVISTFTSGTRDALYTGESYEQARLSLEMSEDDWTGLLASDVRYLEPRA